MMRNLTDSQIAEGLADPELLDRLDRADCKTLRGFTRMMWPIVEPTRRLVEGWAIHAIQDHLTAVTDGHIRKLLINVPPGFMKSLMTSVFWPAWEWGPRGMASMRYVCFSYSEALTMRDNVKCRNIIRSTAYQRLWGDRVTLSDDENGKTKFSNTATGFKFATSIGGVGTGERGDRVILDDPHSIKKVESDAMRESASQFFFEVMPTRINDENSAFVTIMQRTHVSDISGLILANESGYEHLCIPMHYDPKRYSFGTDDHIKPSTIGFTDPRTEEGELAFPERFTENMVADMEKSMRREGDDYAVAGQLEQAPIMRGGGAFKRDDFMIVDSIPPGNYTKVRGWDMAATEGGGDGSASVLTWRCKASGDLYIVDSWWSQVGPANLENQIRDTVKDDGPEVFQSFPQDPGAAGKIAAASLLPVLAGMHYEFTPESGDKEVRANPFASQVRNGAKFGHHVKLLKGDWNKLYLEHVCKFPRGRYKDTVDAQSRSYGALITHKEAPPVSTRGGVQPRVPGSASSEHSSPWG